MREMIDSREGWSVEEELFYNEYVDSTDRRLEMYEDFGPEDFEDFEGTDLEDEDYDSFDEQPDEYTEWQDYMGGDDWDHGQYDCFE